MDRCAARKYRCTMWQALSHSKPPEAMTDTGQEKNARKIYSAKHTSTKGVVRQDTADRSAAPSVPDRVEDVQH